MEDAGNITPQKLQEACETLRAALAAAEVIERWLKENRSPGNRGTPASAAEGVSAARLTERETLSREAVRLQTLKADVTKMLRDRFPLSDYTKTAS